jgi:glycerate kinase
MRHALAPTGEGRADKEALEGDQVMGVAGAVIETALVFLNTVMEEWVLLVRPTVTEAPY